MAGKAIARKCIANDCFNAEPQLHKTILAVVVLCQLEVFLFFENQLRYQKVRSANAKI